MPYRLTVIRAGALACAVALAIATGIASPAGATPAGAGVDSGDRATLTKLSRPGTVLATETLKATRAKSARGVGPMVGEPPDFILCQITAYTPFWFPATFDSPFGTVEAQVSVQCTSPVDRIVIGAYLYWYANEEAGNVSARNGVASYQNWVIAACEDGPWTAIGATIVYFPPGYVPEDGEASHTGPTRNIDC